MIILFLLISPEGRQPWPGRRTNAGRSWPERRHQRRSAWELQKLTYLPRGQAGTRRGGPFVQCASRQPKEVRGCSNQDLIGAQTTCRYAAINDG